MLEFLTIAGWTLLGVLVIFAPAIIYIIFSKKVDDTLGFYIMGSIIFWAIVVAIWIVYSSLQGAKQVSTWDKCVSDANLLYDNFNDTVGASYAHEDQPSKEIQNFIDKCLKNNKLK